MRSNKAIAKLYRDIAREFAEPFIYYPMTNGLDVNAKRVIDTSRAPETLCGIFTYPAKNNDQHHYEASQSTRCPTLVVNMFEFEFSADLKVGDQLTQQRHNLVFEIADIHKFTHDRLKFILLEKGHHTLDYERTYPI